MGKSFEKTFELHKFYGPALHQLGRVISKGNTTRFDISLKNSAPQDTLNIVRFYLAVYTENGWKKVFNNKDLLCQEKIQKATRSDLIEMRLSVREPTWFSMYGIKPEPEAGTEHEAIPYYFALIDCDQSIRYNSTSNWNLTVRLDVNQGGMGHLNLGETIVFWIKTVCLIVFFGLLIKYYKPWVREWRNEDVEKNYAFMMTAAAVMFKYASLFIDVLIALLASGSGDTYPVTTFITKCLDLTSGYFLMMVILFVGSGWTISFSRIDDMELFLPLVVSLGILKLMLFGLSYVLLSEEHHFHAYDGFIGFLIGGLHLCLYVYYLIVRKTSSQNAKIQEASKFYGKLDGISNLYLLSFPVLLFCTLMLKSAYAEVVIESGVTICQLIAAIGLGYILLDKEYSQSADFDFSLPSSTNKWKRKE